MQTGSLALDHAGALSACETGLGLPLSTWVRVKSVSDHGADAVVLSADYPLGIPQHRDHIARLERVYRTQLVAASGCGESALPTLRWQSEVAYHRACAGRKPLPGIRNLIAVVSGKGGVGKSTTAFHLALMLRQQGARVGLLDGDIYGPNQAELFDHHEKPTIGDDEKTVEPVDIHGIRTMSMGYLLHQKDAAIWRGPMVTGALMQLLQQTRWGELDYLIVDLPPGTGDIHLTLMQKVPVTAAVLVTTPERLACSDTAKGHAMLTKMQVPVLGMVVNMAYLDCGDCGAPQPLYRFDHAKTLSEALEVPCLVRMPWQSSLQIQPGEAPFVLNHPDHPLTGQWRQAAGMIALGVGQLPREYAQLFEVEVS